MKKLSILCTALAVAALSFTSCQKEESTTNNQKFIASFEQAGNDKFYVDADLQMYWKDNWMSSTIAVYAPGLADITGYSFTNYYPSSISADGKTAVLEYNNNPEPQDFPANQQGPFYAVSNAVNWATSHINSEGSFHAGGAFSGRYHMPMVGRADNFGAMQFKHLMGILKAYATCPKATPQPLSI